MTTKQEDATEESEYNKPRLFSVKFSLNHGQIFGILTDKISNEWLWEKVKTLTPKDYVLSGVSFFALGTSYFISKDIPNEHLQHLISQDPKGYFSIYTKPLDGSCVIQ